MLGVFTSDVLVVNEMEAKDQNQLLPGYRNNTSTRVVLFLDVLFDLN